MNMTNSDFKKIEAALMLFPNGKEFEALPQEEQDIIIEAEMVMMNLLKKKKRDNKRTSEYIAEKRKTDKNYARRKNNA